MDSLPKPDQKRALETFLQLHATRRTLPKTEEQIADYLDFGSAEAMYIHLKNTGFPPWAITPDGEDKFWAEETHAKGPAHRQKPHNKVEGTAVQLPPASNATDLFRAAIETLVSDLDYIQTHEEVWQDGRFWATGKIPKELFDTEEDVPSTRGAGKYPDMHLVRLIAVYILQADYWAHVERLLERIHRQPEDADREKLWERITSQKDGFVLRAKHIAALMRGGTIKRGGKNVRISDREYAAYLYMKQLSEEGISAEQSKRQVCEMYELTEEEYEAVRTLL